MMNVRRMLEKGVGAMLNEQPTILIIDHEVHVHQIVKASLEQSGYQIRSCYSGKQAISEVTKYQPDLILMEAALPDIDGLFICQQLRKTLDIPILFLSVKSEETDKIVGLTVGADDYISKPFGTGELIARIKAHIRRTMLDVMKEKIPNSYRPENKVISYHSMTIDEQRCEVMLEGQFVELSSKEFKILVLFAKHPGRVFEPEEIYRLIWGCDGLDDFRTVAVHISTLRKKLEKQGAYRMIQNIRGLGYSLS